MKTSLTLPDSLVHQIQTYEGKLKRTETLLAISGGVAGFFVTYVLLFMAERLVDTPKIWRAILLISGSAAAAWFVQRWAKNWLWERRGPVQLAKLLGQHFRGLGDRLQGVVELANTTELPPNVSPALCRAAIAQVAQESSRHDFAEAVATRPSRRWLMAAAAVAALTIAPFLLVPKAATNTAQRWLAPWTNVERYTFASLQDLQADLYVPHGEPFELAVGLKEDTAWRPDSAKARIEDQAAITVAFDQGRALFKFPPQTQQGTLSLRVGDATREIVVHPLHRPEMKGLTAVVEPPAYLQLPESRLPIHGGHAEFLEGSWVRFEGQIARAVGSADMEAPGMPRALAWHAEVFSTPQRLADEIEGPVKFSWKDAHGIAPNAPFALKIATKKDLEPKVELKELAPELAILPHEVLKFNLAASDDFGLKETWLGWSVKGLGEQPKKLAEGTGPKTAGGPQAKETSGVLEWSPIWFKIPEDTLVEIAAYATDYFPDRAPSVSWKHNVFVLSPARHAEKIRDRMEMVLKQLDDRIRDEERQLEENKEIKERKDDLASEKSAEDIKRVEKNERANEEQLKQLTQEMEMVMKDALRNKEIPEGTLGDWKNLTEKLQQQASPAMQEASQQMQQSAQAQQKEQREQELAKAMENQQKALDSMKEAANKMNQVNENLFARNFYNRLRQAAKAQHGVSDSLKSLASNTAGLTPDEIRDEQKTAFNQVAGSQDQNTKEVENIVTDMGVFVTRAPNEKYLAVHTEMEDKKVVAALGELATFVRNNLGLKSVGQARAWGKQLDTWAEMLQSECNCQGEGSGEIPPEVMELMIALVRAAQAQDNIREQTQGVENRKWSTRHYDVEAGKVADLQTDLAQTLSDLRDKTPIEDVKPLLDQVQELMLDVAMELRSPKTDANTVATQSMIIEMLVPPDKKGGKQSKQMQKMQQQMRQMMAKAQKPGKNNNGGASDLAANKGQGAAAGQKDNTRNVEKAGGANNVGEWPEEFRDALQSYFQSLEASEKQP